MNSKDSSWQHEILQAHFRSLSPGAAEVQEVNLLLNDVRSVLVKYADAREPEVGALLSRINQALSVSTPLKRQPMKTAGRTESRQSGEKAG